MELMKEADFRRELKSNPAAGYLFFGEEDYLKAHDLELAKKTVCPDEALAMFNAVDLDALSYCPNALADALAAMPMMAERKLVTVRGVDIGSMRQDEVDALVAVAEQNADGANLLIVTVPDGMLDVGYLPKRPSATLEKLAKVLKPVYFARSTPQQLATWAARHYEANGVTASAAVSSFTVSRCGTDMFRLSAEIRKIAAYVSAHGCTEVTEKDVTEAGIASEEFDGFAFSNALLEGRRADALRVLEDMKQRHVEPVPALTEAVRVWCDIAAVFSLAEEGKSQAEIASLTKMHAYKVGLYARRAAELTREDVRRALAACCEADLSVKTGQGYRALELLVCSV